MPLFSDVTGAENGSFFLAGVGVDSGSYPANVLVYGKVTQGYGLCLYFRKALQPLDMLKKLPRVFSFRTTCQHKL